MFIIALFLRFVKEGGQKSSPLSPVKSPPGDTPPWATTATPTIPTPGSIPSGSRWSKTNPDQWVAQEVHLNLSGFRRDQSAPHLPRSVGRLSAPRRRMATIVFRLKGRGGTAATSAAPSMACGSLLPVAGRWLTPWTDSPATPSRQPARTLLPRPGRRSPTASLSPRPAPWSQPPKVRQLKKPRRCPPSSRPSPCNAFSIKAKRHYSTMTHILARVAQRCPRIA